MLKSHKLAAGFTTAALAATGLGVTIAEAAPTQSIAADVVGTAGTKSKPKPVGVSVTLDTGTSVAGETKPTTKRAEIFLPPTFKYNGKFFASCTEAKLEASGPSGCKSAAKVGSGNAVGYIGNSANANPVALDVQVYNGPAGKSLLLYVSASQPVSVQSVIVAKLIKSDVPGFGMKLDVDIPSNLQSTAGLPTPLGKFVTNITKKTVTKKKKVNGRTKKFKYGFIESTGCSSPGYPFAVRNTYTDNQQAQGKTEAAC